MNGAVMAKTGIDQISFPGSPVDDPRSQDGDIYFL